MLLIVPDHYRISCAVMTCKDGEDDVWFDRVHMFASVLNARRPVTIGGYVLEPVWQLRQMHAPHLQLSHRCVVQGSVLQSQLCGIVHRCTQVAQQSVKLCLQVAKVLTESRHEWAQLMVCSWC